MEESDLALSPIKAVTIGEHSSVGMRLLWATSLITIGNISSRAISLLAGIATARLLTAAEFGAFGVIQNTLGMFGVAAGLSLGMAATRYVALYHVKEPARVGGVVQFVLTLGCVSTLFTTIGVAVFAPWLAIHALGDQSLIRPLQWASFQLSATAVAGIVGGVLAGLQRFAATAVTIVLQNSVVLVCSLILIPQLGILGAISSHALGYFAACILGIWWIRDVLPSTWWRNAWDCARREAVILVDFCLPNILSGIVIFPASWASFVIVANQSNGYSQLAFFTASDRFRLLLSFVAGFLTTALLPILSGSTGESKLDGRANLRGLELGIIATGSLVVPLTAIFAFTGPKLMLLFGRNYAGNWTVLVPVVAWGAIGAIGSTVGTTLVAYGRQWFLFVQQVSYSLTLLTVTYLMRGMGGRGLAFAHLTAVLVLIVWSYPVISKMNLLTDRASRALIGLTAIVCLICGVAWFCPRNYRLFVGIPVTCLATCGSLWGFAKPESVRLLQILRSRKWRVLLRNDSLRL